MKGEKQHAMSLLKLISSVPATCQTSKQTVLLLPSREAAIIGHALAGHSVTVKPATHQRRSDESQSLAMKYSPTQRTYMITQKNLIKNYPYNVTILRNIRDR